MVMWRGATALGLTAALIFSATLFAQSERKLTDVQRQELQNISKLIDGVEAGQPPPDDLSLAWSGHDLLKAQGNKQYVPFTVTIDPSTTSVRTLNVYWRVVGNTPPVGAEQPGQKPNQREVPQFAFEDVNTVTLPSGQKGPARISRSFAVAAGTYDVFVVVKEPAPEKPQRNAPPQKISLLKHTVEIPNLWNDELGTSSVFVAERIDPLPAPLTPQEQAERPYALGAMEIVPTTDSTFAKNEELQTFLLIYNVATDKDAKPDVTVEFSFYAKGPGGEKFFNKTNPQNLNAQTLPPQFDFAAGHQLQSGQAVPLASFPEGEYRLEIRVTDKLANKSLTRDLNFTVVAS